MTDASSIDSFLQKQGSPMAGLGNVFVAAGQKYRIDPALLVGIAGAESSFGKYLFRPHNAWGWGGQTFSNWPEAISTVASGLRSGYANVGALSPAQIVKHYAPASDGNDEQQWVSNVNSFMRELGSTPSGSSTIAPPAETLPTTLPTTAPSGGRQLLSAMPTIRQTIIGSAGLDPQTQVRRLVNTMIGITPGTGLKITPGAGLKIPRVELPGAPSAPTSPGKTVWPYASNVYRGRTDQGVDWIQSSPYLAPKSGTIAAIDPTWYKSNAGHWTPSVYLKFDQPVTVNGRRYPGVFFAETSVIPGMKAGDRVEAGQPIAGGSPGSSLAEQGFAAPIGGSWRQAAYGHYSEGRATQAGQDFVDWLSSIRRGTSRRS